MTDFIEQPTLFDVTAPDGTVHHQVSTDWIVSHYKKAAPMMVLGAVQRQGLAAVDAVHARILRELTGNATIEERDTWPVKLEAAKAHLSGSPDEAQSYLLNKLATARGITTDQYAGLVMGKDQAYKMVVADADAVRDTALGAISVATDQSQIDAALQTFNQNIQTIGA